MQKIWFFDGENRTELRDIIPVEIPKHLTNPMELKMFIMCMKTAEDFIRLSLYIDALPYVNDNWLNEEDEIEESNTIQLTKRKTPAISKIAGFRTFKSRFTSYDNCRLRYCNSIYTYTFKSGAFIDMLQQCSRRLYKNYTIDVFHPNILSIEWINSGKTIMPMPDGFHMQVHRDFTRFTMRGTLWFTCNSGISEIKFLDRLVIKTDKPMHLPIRVRFNYEEADIFADVGDLLLQKNKIVKVNRIWQNIRMNNGECWKSETVRF